MKKIILSELSPEDLVEILCAGLEDQVKKMVLERSNDTSQDDLLTRSQAANYLQINLSTLWSWTKKGKVTALAIGNRVYYKKSEIDSALIKIN